jgi:hypothetical protein
VDQLRKLIKGPSVRDELKSLIEEWRNSGPEGPNLEKMILADKALGPHGRQSGKYLDEALRHAKYRPSKSGRANLTFDTNYSNMDFQQMADSHLGRSFGEARALVLFVELTLNPYWNYLGGPCARCQMYYKNNREDQNVYCSKTCGNAATAVDRNRKHRQE